MTALLAVATVVAGGLGAAARFVVDGWVKQRFAPSGPVGTVVVNVSGSLVLGLVTGLVLGQVLPPAAQVVAGTGFLGGYTTFSTASFETVRLVQERRPLAAVANGLGTLVAASAAAALGLVVGAAVG